MLKYLIVINHKQLLYWSGIHKIFFFLVFTRFSKGILSLSLSYFVKQSTVLSLHSCDRSVADESSKFIFNPE